MLSDHTSDSYSQDVHHIQEGRRSRAVDPWAPGGGNCLERISGPFFGVYLASHAARYENAFYGYAKLCLGQPVDVWTCTAFAKVSSAVAAASAQAAMFTAEQRARAVLQVLAAEDKAFASRVSDA